MSTKMPSVAVLQQKKIVELTEAWNKCKADNARLEAELHKAYRQSDQLRDVCAQQLRRIVDLEGLLVRAIERSVIAPELRAEILAALACEHKAAA